MRVIFILLFGLLITVPTAFGIPIAEKTGLKFKFPIMFDGDSFIIEGTANFDVKHLIFDDVNKEITLKIESSLENNLLEIVFPNNLVRENLTFMIMSMPDSLTQASQLSDTFEIIPKKLHHGDVISQDSEIILIEQLSEKTLTVRFTENDKRLFLLVGHIIGNRHRPISIKNETISFPIHDDSEMELFEKLFHDVINKIDLSTQEEIFIPHESMDVHEH